MFRDATAALDWAYMTAADQIIQTSSVNYMQQEGSRGMQNQLLSGFTVQDRHMQAALILGMVYNLPDPAASAYIGAKFGHRVREEDLKMLVYRCCAALGLDLSACGSVYLILKLYFDGAVGYRTVRRILRCRNQFALMVTNCLYEVLDTTHDRALADMHEKLGEHGLLERAYC